MAGMHRTDCPTAHDHTKPCTCGACPTAIPCPCANGRRFDHCHGASAPPAPPDFRHVTELEKLVRPTGILGFDRIQVMEGDTYKDASTVIVIPSRDQYVHHRIFTSWQGLIGPMNQKRHMMFCYGDEVGHAYNRMIAEILAHPDLKNWKYVMTLETDNLQPADAHIRLLETIEKGRYDGVSGLYWTKGEIQRPMAYGDPARYGATGELEFAPRDIRDGVKYGHVVEVNGIAMGCSLYRMDLFREVPSPWFVTVSDVIEGKGAVGFTQDLFFCKNARARGKRFAVDLRVKVGHLDFATDTLY